MELTSNTAIVGGIAYPFEMTGLVQQKPDKIEKTATSTAVGESGAVMALIIMPGLIIRVLKKEGDWVEAGEVILILEAMKMQNELRANKSGVIRQISVREGKSGGIRQVLAIIE